MKLKFLTILFLSLSLKVAGQILQCEILERASISFCNADYTASIQELLKFQQRFPNHALVEEVSQQIGHLYFLNGNYEKSKTELSKLITGHIVGQNNDDYEALECSTNYDSSAFKCMRIVFPELYINLQHKACIDFYEIYKKEQDYDQALKYLKLADSAYYYQASCAIDQDNHDIELVWYFKEIYLLKKDTNSVIKSLVHGLFKYGSKDVFNSLKYFVNQKYTVTQKAEEIEKSIKSVRQKDLTKGKKTFQLYEMTLFDETIRIPSDWIDYYKIKSVEELKELLNSGQIFLTDL